MQVTMAVLCDAANVSREGKLNVLGIFGALRGLKFPHVHPAMTLVVAVEATWTERGEHAIDIRLVDTDGRELFKLEGRVQVQGERPGRPIVTQAVLQLHNIAFPHPGTYTVDILVDRRHERSVPLQVHGPPEPAAPPGNGPGSTQPAPPPTEPTPPADEPPPSPS